MTLFPAHAVEQSRLVALNREYLRAVERSDRGWFERHLGEDFLCSLPDGALLGKRQFLERTVSPSALSSIEAHEVLVRLLDDVALVHARTTFLEEGRPRRGRYTDVWALRDGDWVAIAAHVTRV